MLVRMRTRWRATARRRGPSAAGLAGVPAAGLTARDPAPVVADDQGEAPLERQLSRAEVRQVVPDPAHALPDTSRVTDERVVRTKHAELSLEQMAELLPSTGEIMQAVALCWWKCAYAARGGNWPLAAYFARRVRGLQGNLAVLRPKHRERLLEFERGALTELLAAIAAQDGAAFEQVFLAATDLANRMHGETGHGYIRWVLPDGPPEDLDLGRVVSPQT